MPNRKKVVLYGGSLFIACLEASLSSIPELQVQYIEEQGDNGLEQVRLATPDVIVFELGVGSDSFTLNLLQKFPEILLIGLDPESDRLMILSVQQDRALVTSDLVKVIWSQYPSRKE